MHVKKVHNLTFHVKNVFKIIYLYLSIFPGAFELAIIRMSRYFDLSQNAVLFMNCMLPMEAFMNNRDTTEMKLVSQIFDFAKSIAEMRLSDVALALYSAYILLQEGKSYYYDFVLTQLCEIILMTIFFLSFLSDRQSLRNVEEVRKLSEAVVGALQRELTKNPPNVPIKGDVSILSRLLNKRGALR